MHDDGVFGEEVAARYDELHAEKADPAVVDPIVDVIAELAGNGRALELAIGTGCNGLGEVAGPLSRM